MLRNLLAVLLLIWCLSPQIAAANTAVVRGGEHAEFTRLTISTERPILGTELFAIGERQYNLRTTPVIDVLDVSKMFDRLSAKRVDRLTLTEGGLELLLNCDCEPQLDTENERLIVIDIKKRADEAVVLLPELPIAPGGFPDSLVTHSRPVNASEIFDLDFSVVDRLSKSIAAQVSQNSHISGFSDVGTLANDVIMSPENPVTKAQSDDRAGKPEEPCFWSDSVWTLIETSFEESVSEEGRGIDHIEGRELPLMEGDRAAFQDWVVEYLSQGLFDEAQNAFEALRPTLEETTRFSNFVNGLSGLDSPRHTRFGQCNPLADLLVATSYVGSDVPKDLKLDLLHNFGKLPVGLQIVLYPRLEWLLDEASSALFPALTLHRNAELALAERTPNLADKVDMDMADPDRLAAVTLELRGTDLEKESWLATFASYLDNQRYFDAIADLTSQNPLSDTDQVHSVAELLDHLVTHADSVTFVQIALANLSDLTPWPSPTDLQRISDRLETEGFGAEARLFSRTFATNPLESSLTTSPLVSRDSRAVANDIESSMNTPNKVAIEPKETDPLTVATARKQLETAGSVRKALTEKFGN